MLKALFEVRLEQAGVNEELKDAAEFGRRFSMEQFSNSIQGCF